MIYLFFSIVTILIIIVVYKTIKANDKIIDEVHDQNYRCSLLLKNGFIEECRIRRSDMTITIIPTKATIIFDGFFNSVVFCKQKMLEFFNSIKSKDWNASF